MNKPVTVYVPDGNLKEIMKSFDINGKDVLLVVGSEVMKELPSVYVLTKEELEQELGKAFDAGKRHEQWKREKSMWSFQQPDKDQYIKSLNK